MDPRFKSARRFVGVLCGLLIVPSLLLAPACAWSLTYCPLPMVDPARVVTESRPFLDYLSRALGRDIRIDYRPSNAEVVRAFSEDKIDLAEIGPLPYLVLRETVPHAQALLFFLEEGATRTYTCALVAPFDGAADPRALLADRPQELVVPQMLSTCGPLSAVWLLHQCDPEMAPPPFRALGNHESVALSVIRAEVPAGSMKTLIARRYASLGLRILAETPPLPVFALVVNTRTLSEETIADIARALCAAGPAERTGWTIGRHGFEKAEENAYRPLEEMLGKLGRRAGDFLLP
ncbi:phosphonate transport system substrate-binding protein [Geoalkalibacter ferrihydriticus]|uniref:Phosphonate transport system substrate-binding protein n=1 Tax=Geoalkalibacter ferrihydriticus TaxID=392333 RepID=A0A1G9TPL1_9BACT|nr:PhnD/SsuA/transferrin family substrate-binding protein [Geoalkalibacter ferrihydriticus]SDM49045.1 phosphonate transport system substrate-binding protein [Geoalkalibacter ferrihydriticus]